jgi:hypothetical protein
VKVSLAFLRSHELRDREALPDTWVTALGWRLAGPLAGAAVVWLLAGA